MFGDIAGGTGGQCIRGELFAAMRCHHHNRGRSATLLELARTSCRPSRLGIRMSVSTRSGRDLSSTCAMASAPSIGIENRKIGILSQGYCQSIDVPLQDRRQLVSWAYGPLSAVTPRNVRLACFPRLYRFSVLSFINRDEFSCGGSHGRPAAACKFAS